MSYYVNVEKEGQEIQVKGVFNGKELFVAAGKPEKEWKVVIKEPFPEDLDNCLDIAELFNSVVIEAKKQRVNNQVKDIDFSVSNASEEELENRFDCEVYELGVRDDMSVGEVRTVVFRDIDGKLFEVTYSCYMEYDYTEHLHIDSYEEIK